MQFDDAKKVLGQARDWAKAKLESGQEPPWSWYQLMKLVETTEAILAGMEATSPMGNSQQSEEHQGKRLRLVDSKYRQDNAQPRPSDSPIQMPM